MEKLKYAICIFILLFFPVLVSAQNLAGIAKVEVTGNERIDTAFIYNNIKIKEGDPYDLNKIREDMKSIYRTGFFSDVQIDVKDIEQGKAVTFVVIERPTVRSISIDGNRKIKTADLTDKLKVTTGTVLNIEKIKESIDEIKKHYASKGYYATKVTYDIDYGETYDAQINFIVEEPQQAYVRKITFTGNKAFKDGTLKAYMKTKEKGIFSWFTGSGILDEDDLLDDQRTIEAFYHDNGYAKVQVGVPDVAISRDGKSITIAFTVNEGSVYRVGTIDFTGDLIVPKEELARDLKTRTGNVFRSTLFYGDLIVINDLYQDRGYAFCDVAPLTMIDDSTNEVNVTFSITKNEEVYFNRINVLGNTRTRDKVIRRELKFAEGDRFSITNIKDSQKKLKNTTFFKDTDFKVVKTDDPQKVNVDLTVEEKPTGTFSVGAGYSTAEKIIVSGSVSEDNLFGTGRKLFLEAALSSYTQEYRLSFLEPYIFDRDLSAGFSVFNFEREMDTYDYRKTGGNVSLTRGLTDTVKGSIRYRLEDTKIWNLQSDASKYIRDQAGKALTSSVTLSLGQNTIDDIMNPTKGMNSEIALETAGGPFGGDNYFVTATAFYGRYFPIKFMESAFFVKGTAGSIRGYSGRDIPLIEKFYVGGINSIRGFRFGEAGPQDENEEPIGAKNQLFFNFEWIFPIYKPAGVKGVIFTDTGAGFDSFDSFRLRTSAGFGIRWFSPLGPIRLELGFNLNPREGERKSLFDFAIGTQY